MALSKRWTAAAVVGVLGIAGAFVIVPDPPPVVTVSPEAGEAAYTSIQEAVDSLPAGGGTVEVLEGRYAERVVLDGLRRVAVRARTGDEVVLDASRLTPPEGRSGVVEVRGGSLIEVAGLQVTGYRSSDPAAVPVGVLSTGSVDGLTLSDLQVHGIGTSLEDGVGAEGAAHGIAVVGDGAGAADDVLISSVEVFGLDLGTGHAVTVTGDIVGWEVSKSHVHGVDNVGVAATDGARAGTIHSNVVEDVSGATNPAHGPEGCACAGAIEVDGAVEITVRDNTVQRTDLGVTVVASDPEGGGTEGVDVVDNEIIEPRASGLVVGGEPGAGGPVSRVLVRGNRVLGTQDAGPESPPLVRLAAGLSDVRVSSNEVIAQAAAGVLLQMAARGPVLDHNHYTATEPRFLLGERELTDLRSWQLTTRQDPSSTVSEP